MCWHTVYGCLVLVTLVSPAFCEEIVEPEEDSTWTTPGTHYFKAEDCYGSEPYIVRVKYKTSSGQWSQLTSQGVTADEHDVIEANISLTTNTIYGIHEGKVILEIFDYIFMEWREAASVDIEIDGGDPPGP